MSVSPGSVKIARLQPEGSAARWLGFAATPVFVAMAVLILVNGDGPAEVLCSAAHGGSPLGGMMPMYLLMGVFHSGPWLRLFAER